MREGDFKLVAETGAEPELYNLVADPMEAADLLADGTSDDEAAIVEAIETRLRTIRGE